MTLRPQLSEKTLQLKQHYIRPGESGYNQVEDSNHKPKLDYATVNDIRDCTFRPCLAPRSVFLMRDKLCGSDKNKEEWHDRLYRGRDGADRMGCRHTDFLQEALDGPGHRPKLS